MTDFFLIGINFKYLRNFVVGGFNVNTLFEAFAVRKNRISKSDISDYHVQHRFK